MDFLASLVTTFQSEQLKKTAMELRKIQDGAQTVLENMNETISYYTSLKGEEEARKTQWVHHYRSYTCKHFILLL